MPSNLDRNNAAETKDRLRADLTAAMRARDALSVRVLRSLIGALDNAEAVPPGERHARYELIPFGEPGAEIPRLVLGPAEVTDILAREAVQRRAAAANLVAMGRVDAAHVLIAEADVIDAYR